jgi:hypothetical protein
MKLHSPARVSVTVLGLAGMLGSIHPAMSQAQKPATAPVPAQESPRSFPPDTTPYVRPVIPEDTLNAPLWTPGGSDATVPEPPTRTEKEPSGASENPPPQPRLR